MKKDLNSVYLSINSFLPWNELDFLSQNITWEATSAAHASSRGRRESARVIPAVRSCLTASAICRMCSTCLASVIPSGCQSQWNSRQGIPLVLTLSCSPDNVLMTSPSTFFPDASRSITDTPSNRINNVIVTVAMKTFHVNSI